MYKEVIKIIELATSYYVKGYKPTKENSPTSDQQDCLSKTILKVQSIFSSSQNIILGYFFNPVRIIAASARYVGKEVLIYSVLYFLSAYVYLFINKGLGEAIAADGLASTMISKMGFYLLVLATPIYLCLFRHPILFIRDDSKGAVIELIAENIKDLGANNVKGQEIYEVLFSRINKRLNFIKATVLLVSTTFFYQILFPYYERRDSFNLDDSISMSLLMLVVIFLLFITWGYVFLIESITSSIKVAFIESLD